MAYPIPAGLVLEACVENLDEALLAQSNGAHRVELCANLATGGLTPPPTLVLEARSLLSIPIMVMIRPRAGNFFYNNTELAEMQRQIDFCKRVGVAGVVFGLLERNGKIDLENTASLAAFARPLWVTFHKAIDETPDPVTAVRQLTGISNIQRVLSSGGAPTALQGKETLRRMIEAAGASLTIVAGGKVMKENLPIVHTAIGAREYHGRRIVF